MTGLADESLPERVRSVGDRTTLIRKPFQVQQLKAAVALVLPSPTLLSAEIRPPCPWTMHFEM